MDDELRRRADDNLARMRADTTSDWPDRLLAELSEMALGDPGKLPQRTNWTARTSLTPPELRVLQAAAVGLTTAMTADMSGFSENTVHTHRQACIYKLRAKDITHAVAIAFRQGIIT